MIKTGLFYLDFFVYMYKTFLKRDKLESLEKMGNKEEAEACLNKILKDWAWHVINKAGAKIQVIGKENIPNETCLYVANHQGNMDIPILVASLDRDKPIGFIAKKDLLKFKSVSYWMKRIHCVFIDRDNVRESIKSINEGIENLKQGYSMIIYPEGTRSKGPNMGGFKKGSMKLGLKAGVPIVPVCIDGSYKLIEGNKGGRVRPAEVKITICKPIYPNELSREEQGNLSETIKNIIASNIDS